MGSVTAESRLPPLARPYSPLVLHLSTWAVLLAVPLALVLTLRFRGDWNPLFVGPMHHVYIVSATSLTALLAAALVAFSGRRLQQPRLVFLTTAFLAIAGVFSVHGLATPGFFVEDEYFGTVKVSAYLALASGAALMALTTVELPGWASAWVRRHAGTLYGITLGVLLGYAALGLLLPEALDDPPVPEPLYRWPLPGLTLALFAVAGYRTLRSYMLSRLPMQGALIIAVVLLGEAQVAMVLPPPWSLAWWLYHVLLLLGFLTGLYVAIQQYLQGHSAAAIVDQLALRGILDEVKRGYAETAVALAAAAEARDSYTFDHINRVAELSLMVGREMGLPPDRLRVLAQGAMLHDIGKLYVSDTVLLKPGSLSPEEVQAIQAHPALGHELLLRLRGFRREAIIVRQHHEWYDGSGYPDGLRGEAICLEARIVATADVYDALTSERPYRRAFSHEEALAQIREEAGSHLDPACVAAFLRVIERQNQAKRQGQAEEGRPQPSYALP